MRILTWRLPFRVSAENRQAASLRFRALLGAGALAATVLLPGLSADSGAPVAPADQPATAHREPAWRHPQGYPRPSPDRVYAPHPTS
jgi:hypothetical protein